jgi:hypothetical protein
VPAAAGLDAEKIKDVDEDEFGAKVGCSQLGFESSILQNINNMRNLSRDVGNSVKVKSYFSFLIWRRNILLYQRGIWFYIVSFPICCLKHLISFSEL